MLDTGLYLTGANAIFMAAQETAQSPGSTPPATIPAPALPPGFIRPRFVQSSSVDNGLRARPIRQMGSIESGGFIPAPKGPVYQNVVWCLSPNDGLLPLCLLGSADKFPGVCLIHGGRDESTGESTIKAQRFSVCQSLDIEFQDGPITAHARFMGLADEPATVTAPVLPAPVLSFAPFQWKDVRTIGVYGVDVRGLCDGVAFGVDYALDTGPYRPWYDTDTFSSPWSGVPFAISVSSVDYTATLNFKSADALAWVLANNPSKSAGVFFMYLQDEQGRTLTITGQHGERNGSSRTNAEGRASTSRLPLALRHLQFDFG